MHIALAEVPLAARRIAAQHLASIHGTEMSTVADGAFLADRVVPIYRPDLKEVAYYEFTIAGPEGGKRVLQSRAYAHGVSDKIASKYVGNVKAGTAIGFVIVSNGRHDFPISHWSVNRQPPSLQVAQDKGKELCDCEPLEGGSRGTPARLYRLDALAYAAEDVTGQLVGRTGQMPALLSGLPHSLINFAGQVSSSESRSVSRERTDDTADEAKHELERTGPKEPLKVQMVDNSDWGTFKDRYADAFGPLLDQLRDRAARTWELYDLIEKMGEGIETGTTHRVTLLGPAAVEITGPGRKFVRPFLDDMDDGHPALVIETERATLQAELDLEVRIEYPHGERETLKFFLYNQDIPSNEKGRHSGECGNCKE